MVGQPAEKVVPFRQYFPDWHEGVWETGENLMYGGHSVIPRAMTAQAILIGHLLPKMLCSNCGVSKETALPWKKTYRFAIYKKGDHGLQDELIRLLWTLPTHLLGIRKRGKFKWLDVLHVKPLLYLGASITGVCISRFY